MPVSLATVMGQRAETTLEVSGEIVRVVYNPSVLTPKKLSEASRAGEDEAAASLIVSLLTASILEWDLMTGESKGSEPVPITAEALSELPFWFLNRLLRKIGDDQVPNATRNGSSGSFS